MSFDPRVIGKANVASITRELLFEDERAERLKMPFADRWIQRDQFNSEWVTLELDVGSVMNFTDPWQAEMADRVRSVLEEVGRICKDEWHWYTGERTITADYYASELTGGGVRDPDDDRIVAMPSDHRKFLTLNFASKDDAMLVRMTVLDLRSVPNANGGILPSAS